ncbi:hypothetical protein [Lentilactobacillus farraginis]|uniref:Uncharacterized protein n=1 Tax=Lentilactobacillus farraginis DSM 18382 = JCM 14108 TaxID=1423743 RepID=A0A0R1VW03_9LACO|nr:hypothetical protein [Lentilactobacillus farraginis]KRM09613.1 hypothetical protein FD41_GL002499 [Lentilactobacillus farraginis DSM 18382 = JCM 14108]
MKGNFIFINTNPISNMILSSGITAADYVNGLDELPDNIILLNDDVDAANGYNSHSRFNLINGAGEIRRYLLRASLKPKKFIDFNNEDNVNSLSPFEIAELLYLGHMGTPMGRPFSSKLLNHYIYLDLENDTTRSYYRRFSDFNHVLEIAVKRHLREVHNTLRVFLRPLAIKDVDNSILIKLITQANDGLFITFGDLREKNRVYHIPLRVLKNPDQVSIILKTRAITNNTDYIGDLTYDLQRSQWQLQWQDQAADV